MARLPAPIRSADPRRVPWQVVLTVGLRIAQESRKRWDRLTQREQREVVRIIRKSRGRASNITAKERTELRRLVGKALGL